VPPCRERIITKDHNINQMTEQQFNHLLATINGTNTKLLPGFIIDCPWLPNWAGISVMDYFSSEEKWYQSHLLAAKTFPDAIFLPGFWSEFGMCTEPSAFGARCSFPENEFPHAHKLINSIEEVDNITAPKVDQDGFLPYMIKRLQHYEKAMNQEGHHIKFSVSRGPLNIATYLMGTTEFLMAMMMDPVKTHKLIRIISDFLHRWHDYQKSVFPSIDGIMMLDDIIGFMSRDQFEEFGLPYFKELYNKPVSIKLLHNDAPSKESAPLLNEMGVNLFNMGIDVTLGEIAEQSDNKVCLLGNLPPRDVLAAETPEVVYSKTKKLIKTIKPEMNVVLSCGGGMPPAVSTENIQAFIKATRESNH